MNTKRAQYIDCWAGSGRLTRSCARFAGVCLSVSCWGMLAVGAALAQPDTQHPSKPGRDVEFTLPLTDKTAKDVDRAIEWLGSPDFAKREHGSQVLSSIGALGLGKLRDAYRQADDLEVRLRIERIVKQAYINFHIFSRNGFLGIERQRRVFLTHEDDERIGLGWCGIRVTKVQKNTGAARAGLMANDIVVALNSRPFPLDAHPSATFGDIIRRNPPDSTITLTILRGEQTLQRTATLGTCPPGDVRPGRMDSVARDLAEAKAQFGSWWERNFMDRSNVAHANP